MAEQSIRLSPQKDVDIQFNLSEKSLLTLTLPQLKLKQLPAQIGPASETTSMIKRSRLHEVQSSNAWSVNIESSIPFGSEPEILRMWDIEGNHARVVSDIRVGSPCKFDRLENDSIEISGKWKELKLLTLNTDSMQLETRIVLPENKENLVYKDSMPWISVVVTSENGDQLEVTTGEDLWRRFQLDENTKAEFSLLATKDTLTLKRVLGIWNADTTWAQRTWRSKWHIAWLCTSQKISTPTSRDKTVIDFATMTFPQNSQQSRTGGVCMMASPTLSTLKKKIRSLIGSRENMNVLITHWTPGFCDIASHCGRNSQKKLLHHDVSEMLQFFEWANRTLVRNGGCLRINVAKDSPWAQLPSIQGLKIKSEKRN